MRLWYLRRCWISSFLRTFWTLLWRLLNLNLWERSRFDLGWFLPRRLMTRISMGIPQGRIQVLTLYKPIFKARWFKFFTFLRLLRVRWTKSIWIFFDWHCMCCGFRKGGIIRELVVWELFLLLKVVTVIFLPFFPWIPSRCMISKLLWYHRDVAWWQVTLQISIKSHDVLHKLWGHWMQPWLKFS